MKHEFGGFDDPVEALFSGCNEYTTYNLKDILKYGLDLQMYSILQ